MPSSILIFCGKGGVGKTTVSLAFALKHAAAGKRVLVVSSHPLAELAIAISLKGLSEQYPVAGKNLFVVHLDPYELVVEVVHRNFPVAGDAMARTALFRNLVQVAPGLKSFYFLARLQQLAERKASHSPAPDYEFLLWDAPATGHFLSTLNAARTFEHYLTGPLAAAGAEVARFFSDVSNISVFPVTTLEEMAITETIELTRHLDRDFHLKSAAVILNMVSPLVDAPESDVAQLGQPNDPALSFAFERGRMEREQAQSLREVLSAPTLSITRLTRAATDLELLNRIGTMLKTPLPV